MSRNIIGENNPRWNGGVSEYPKHALMKKNRLIKLRESGGKCEACGKEAAFIHHLDGSRDNHELSNLAALCQKCHALLHRGDGRRNPSTKYSRLYGMTLREMTERFGGTMPTYATMHKNGRLAGFISSRKAAKA